MSAKDSHEKGFETFLDVIEYVREEIVEPYAEDYSDVSFSEKEDWESDFCNLGIEYSLDVADKGSVQIAVEDFDEIKVRNDYGDSRSHTMVAEPEAADNLVQEFYNDLRFS